MVRLFRGPDYLVSPNVALGEADHSDGGNSRRDKAKATMELIRPCPASHRNMLVANGIGFLTGAGQGVADGPAQLEHRLPRGVDGRITLAVDISPWLRPDAPSSAQRMFCHVQAWRLTCLLISDRCC